MIISFTYFELKMDLEHGGGHGHDGGGHGHDSGGHGHGGGGHMGMAMYFTWDTNIPSILFSWWTVKSGYGTSPWAGIDVFMTF